MASSREAGHAGKGVPQPAPISERAWVLRARRNVWFHARGGSTKQNGAPIRIVVPWKYGYKSIKSIVRIDFVDKQPPTLWETLAPDEYPFESNVNPNIRHPRWLQSTERVVDTGNRVNTILYNGYGEYVAKLYAKS
jgi:methionine sulfoxide reductase catalytic subunit